MGVWLSEASEVSDKLGVRRGVIVDDWVVNVVVVLVLVLRLVEAVADIEALDDDVSELLVVCEKLRDTVCDWLREVERDNDSEGLSELLEVAELLMVMLLDGVALCDILVVRVGLNDDDAVSETDVLVEALNDPLGVYV